MNFKVFAVLLVSLSMSLAGCAGRQDASTAPSTSATSQTQPAASGPSHAATLAARKADN